MRSMSAFYRESTASLSLLRIIALAFLAPLTGLSATSVTLAWDPSASTNVAGYVVYYGVATGAYTNFVAAGNATNTTITGLVAGTTYYFAATALDADGLESGYSTEITCTLSLPNQPPTLDALANLMILENAGLQTVNLTGIGSGAASESQTLTVTASSSNTGLIPNPTVTYTSPSATGSIAFTPVTDAFGSATITVNVNDGSSTNSSVTRTFTVTVSPVNHAPTLNALANVAINQNAGLQTVSLTGIASGAANESQTLTVTAASGNTALIPNPTVTYTSPNTTGSIAFKPVTNAYGTATVTVTVNDGGTSNNVISQSFTVTVNALPTLSSFTNRVVALDASTTVPFTIGDAETAAASLVVSATSDKQAVVANAGIVTGGTGASRTLTITPAGQGNARITVTVSDGTGSASSAFTLSVRQRPSPPGGLRALGQ
jgi:hypothetical protein